MEPSQLKKALQDEAFRAALFEVLDKRYVSQTEQPAAPAQNKTPTLRATDSGTPETSLLSTEALLRMSAFLAEYCMVSQKHYSKEAYLELLRMFTTAAFGPALVEAHEMVLLGFVETFLERPEFPLCGDSKNKANPPDKPISWRGFRFKQVFE